MRDYEFNSSERKLLCTLTTPARIQRFLDREVDYNKERDGETCRSPRRVMRERLAHCMEGALLAAAALRRLGFPPLLVYLEAERDDDHVLAVFHQHGLWGAVAKSNYSGLRFREPVYRSLRELVMSYFEHYFNLAKEKSLRAYTRPMNLARFDHAGWMTREEDLWDVSDYLGERPRRRILPWSIERSLNRVDDRLFQAGCLGRVE